MDQESRMRYFVLFLLILARTCCSKDVVFTPVGNSEAIQEKETDYTSISTSSAIDSKAADRVPDAETSEIIVRNTFAHPPIDKESISNEESSEEEPDGPPDHEIPRSEHEEPRNVSTRPNYTYPGQWAKPMNKNVKLDFVPTKLYAQVRGTHTVKRLPQAEAVKSAETDEEKLNAPRLREVVSNSKINTVYTEEGYEDSAYDHAGQIRDADFHEGFARKLHDQRNSKKKSKSEGDDEKKKVSGKKYRIVNPEEFKEYDDDYDDHLDEIRKEKTSGEHSEDHDNIEDNTDNIWIDPKLVAENGIEKLERDIRKENEEIESSESYEPQKLKKSGATEILNPMESHSVSNYTDESTQPARIKERKIAPSQGLTRDQDNDKEKDPFIRKKKRKNVHSNTEIPANGQFTSTIRTSSIASEENAHSPSAGDTTIDYGELFWNFFKDKQNTSEQSAVEESTIESVQATQKEFRATTVPSLAESQTVNSQTFSPTDSSESTESVNNQHSTNEDQDYTQDADNAVTPRIFNFHEEAGTYQSSKPVDFEQAISQTEKPLSSEVITETIPATPSTPAQSDNEDSTSVTNSFPTPSPAKSTNQKKSKYKLLLRHKPHKSSKHPSHKKPLPKAFNSHPKPPKNPPTDIVKENYLKMLNYLKAQHPVQPYISNANEPNYNANFFQGTPRDLTYLRPPPNPQFLPDQRNNLIAFGQSAVSIPSEPLRNPSWRKLPIDTQYRPAVPLDRFAAVRSPVSIGGASIAQPIAPLSFLNADFARHTADQRFLAGSRNRNFGQPLRYVDFDFRRIRARKKRDADFRVRSANNAGTNLAADKTVTNSSRNVTRRDVVPETSVPSAEREITMKKLRNAFDRSLRKPDGVILDGENNVGLDVDGNEGKYNEGNSADGGLGTNVLSKRDVSEEPIERSEKPFNEEGTVGSRTKAIRVKRGDGKKGHEKLLNESPRVIDDVVNEELNARFTKGNSSEKQADQREKIVEVDVPEFDYVEELEENHPVARSTTESSINAKKYPFYKDDSVPNMSVLKYVVDPRTIPQKTPGGMEFYESRNSYRCEEIDPNVDEVLPKTEEPVPERGPNENLPRLRDLGNKLDCFKAKYFDEDPFDSPLFSEKQVEEPTTPSELDPSKFSSRILRISDETDEHVAQKLSKRPEESSRRRRPVSNDQKENREQSIHIDYKRDPRTGRGRNIYFHSVRKSVTRNPAAGRRKPRPRPVLVQNYPPRYQKQIYDDIMGNIKSMANSYKNFEITTYSPAPKILTSSSNVRNTVLGVSNFTEDSKTVPVNVTQIPINNFDIEGLVPPKYPGRQSRPTVRRYKIIRNGRNLRSFSDGSDRFRPIGEIQRIRISKRNAENQTVLQNTTSLRNLTENQEIATKVPINITEFQSTSKVLQTSDLIIEENTIPVTTDIILSTTPTSTVTTTTRKSSESSQKVLYTIKDRIRFSKPKEETRGFGKFTVKNVPEEDSRRKEPKYNLVKPRYSTNRVLSLTSTTMPSVTARSTTELPKLNETQVPDQEGEGSRQISHSILYKPSRGTTETLGNFITMNPEKSEIDLQIVTVKPSSSYDVYEKIEENVTTTTPKSPESSTSAEYSRLKNYLETDPPGYAETFPEEFSKNTAKNDSSGSLELISPDFGSGEDKKEDRRGNRKRVSSHRSHPSDKISSEVQEGSNSNIRTSKKADDSSDENKSSVENVSEDAKDEKHSDLHSRSEPTFYHPPFWASGYKKLHRESDEDSETEDSEEGRAKYGFPWHQHEDTRGNHRYFTIARYEYPWERRERLARERRRKKKKGKYGKVRGEDEESDESALPTRRFPFYRRYIYPWERYEIPSRYRDGKHKIWHEDVDSEESSSESRPRYSSRYRYRDFNPPDKEDRSKLQDKSVENASEEETEKPTSSAEANNDGASKKKISEEIRSSEEVTEVPKRKTGRKQVSRETESTESTSESTKLARNKERNEEKREPVTSDQGNLDKLESSQIVSVTVDPGLAKAERIADRSRNKRRRKNFRDTFTAEKESSLKPATKTVNKTRRKLRTSSTTPIAITDTLTTTSSPRIIRRNQRFNSEKRKSEFPALKTDQSRLSTSSDVNSENSKPKSGEIEHRSKISREKISTKTSYPKQTSFDLIKNSPVVNKSAEIVDEREDFGRKTDADRESELKEQERESEPQMNLKKNPERRLYYYVEEK